MAMGECWINARDMIINKTFITGELTSDEVQYALKKNISHIVYTKGLENVNLPKNVNAIRSTDARIPAGWWFRDLYQPTINQLPKRWLHHEGFKLNNALIKLTSWSFPQESQEGYALHSFHLASPKQILKWIFKHNVISCALVLIFKWANQFPNKINIPANIIPINRLIFFVKSKAELDIWNNLIEEFNPTEIAIVLDPMSTIAEVDLFKYKQKGIVISTCGITFCKKYFKPFPTLSNRVSMNIQRNIYNQLSLINTYLAGSNWIKNMQPKGVIFNAAENRGEIHLMSEYLLKNKIPTFNTMNGIKARTANNANVQFTTWFVWDKTMQDILATCEVPLNMMKIKGHLMQDVANKYVFNNTLKHVQDYYNTKKVLLIATSPFAQDERNNLKKAISAFIAKGFYVLWKDHPAIEDKFEYDHDCFEKIGKDFNKETLYDALTVASLVIVSGSTIAIEASWFHVPVLSYEESDESLLYLVKLGSVKQVRSIAELMEAEAAIQYEKDNQNTPSTISIAAAYKQEIMDCIKRHG